MKKISLVLGFLVASVFTLTAYSAEQMAAPASGQMKQEKMKPMKKMSAKMAMGEVASIDAATNMMTLKMKSKTMDFMINSDVVVKKGKEMMKVSDVMVGDKIKVKYMMENDKMTASMIQIEPMKKMKKMEKMENMEKMEKK